MMMLAKVVEYLKSNGVEDELTVDPRLGSRNLLVI
jgi:hypothetical protein